MLDKIKEMRKDELLKGSLILFIMMGVFNIFNYAFQISMAKMLGPADYGIFAVLMSFVYIFSIPGEAIQTIVSKYTSQFNIKKEFGKMKDLMYRGLRKGFFFATIIFIIYLIMTFFLSSFLKIDLLLLIITGLLIFYVMVSAIIRGITQGRKKFLGLGINMVIESLIKFVAAVALVWAGWRAYGAMAGVIIGCFIAFFAGFFIIKEVWFSKRKREDFKGIYLSNLPVLISITAIVLMYSLDIIIARKFFAPELAGQYAFVSMIGKTILFVSVAIGKAMFPISSEKFEGGEKTFGLFKKSIILITAISGISLIFCFFFPEQIVKIVSLGSLEYLGASNVLFILAMTFSLISLSNIMILYNLSVNKIKKSAFFMLFFVVLQVILLSIFHSSLIEFSMALFSVSIIMFLYSLFLTKIKN